MLLAFNQIFRTIETKPKLLKRTFADVYGPDHTPINYTGLERTGTPLTPNTKNVYVYDCVFRNCLSTYYGGALYCRDNVYRLLVEHSSFISCKTSEKYGGGIYFTNTYNGECVLSRICGFNCSSIISGDIYNDGQFAIIYILCNTNNRNHVNDSSITHSSKESIKPYSVLYLENGNILCPSVNLTNNECYSYPVFNSIPTESTESDTCIISFNSIINNTANGGYGCILLNKATTSQRIDTCNIINNRQTFTTFGTIRAVSNLFIKDSCILGNNEGGIVFYAETHFSCTITISNCTIDDDIISNSRYIGTVTINKTVESTFINTLSHIATQGCDSYITVKPKVPFESSRYLIFYNIKKAIIDSLRNIQFIFLLAMLPSDSSDDDYFNSGFRE